MWSPYRCQVLEFALCGPSSISEIIDHIFELVEQTRSVSPGKAKIQNWVHFDGQEQGHGQGQCRGKLEGYGLGQCKGEVEGHGQEQ